MNNNEIRLEVRRMRSRITAANIEIGGATDRILVLQNRCEHSGVEKYKGYLIGVCSTCEKVFPTRADIDVMSEG